MVRPAPSLAHLPAVFRHATRRDAIDLYLERRAEHVLRFVSGNLVEHTVVLHEGAAVRGAGWQRAADGLDRLTLAALIGVPAGQLPPVEIPDWPAPLEPARLARAVAAHGTVRTIARWSAVATATPPALHILEHPLLIEIRPAGGRGRLVTLTALDTITATRGTEPDDREPGKVRAGPARVALTPGAAAVLLHELFGHPLEADALVRGDSPWSGRIGQIVTPLALDLVDDPWRRDLPGSFDVDDEGTPARPRPLLAAGRIVGALADRAHAAALHTSPGNGRRSGIQSPPRPRMSNLIARVAGGGKTIDLGEARLLISEVTSGTVEPRSGSIILRVGRGHVVRRGSIERRLQPFTLAGSLDAVCRGLLAATAEPEIADTPAWCGKNGELVAVGAAAPWLLVDGLEAR